MSDEFSYAFRRHSIVLTRESADRNWYIVVTAPSGLKCYDGWWRDSAGKTLKEALQEAKEGAMLVKPLGVAAPAPSIPAAGHSWHDYGQLAGEDVSWCSRCDELAFTGREPDGPCGVKELDNQTFSASSTGGVESE